MRVYANGPETLLGHTVGGYQLVRILGQGATGAVFLGVMSQGSADFTRLGRTDPTLALNERPRPSQVAIKLLLLPWQVTTQERANFRLRFRREAEALLRLRHAAILPLLAFGEDGPTQIPYMILPYLSGGTLFDLQQQLRQVYLVRHVPTPPLPLSVIRHDLALLASALDYAHQRSIIHRDLKPSNILYDQHGLPALADFSLAAFHDSTHTTLTTLGAVIGTPLYVAPELIHDQLATPAADVYSLGIVVYELVTGRPPFQGTPFELFLQHTSAAPPSPRRIRSDLPPDAEAVLLRALAKRPEERFVSAGAFAHAFAASVAAQQEQRGGRSAFAHTGQLSNIVRLITLGRETGLLRVRQAPGTPQPIHGAEHNLEHDMAPGEEETIGEIGFLEGQMVYAATESLKGTSALRSLEQWENCSFLFLQDEDPLAEATTLTVVDYVKSVQHTAQVRQEEAWNPQ